MKSMVSLLIPRKGLSKRSSQLQSPHPLYFSSLINHSVHYNGTVPSSFHNESPITYSWSGYFMKEMKVVHNRQIEVKSF